MKKADMERKKGSIIKVGVIAKKEDK